jgi:hypothetical protein
MVFPLIWVIIFIINVKYAINDTPWNSTNFENTTRVKCFYIQLKYSQTYDLSPLLSLQTK